MVSDFTQSYRSWRRTPRLALTLLACIALAIGGELGLLLAAWLSSVFTRVAGTSLLAQVTVAFGSAPLALCLVVAVAACLLPARRAAQTSPTEALRAE